MKRQEMQISEWELRKLTRDMDDHHNEVMPRMRARVDEWIELERQARTKVGKIVVAAATRRTFLKGSGIVVGSLALAACGAESGTSASPSSGKLTGDLQIAGMAASLENLAVGTYMAGLEAATAGKLGTVPPSIAEFAKTAMRQHQEHSDAWNAIVTKNGHAKVTETDQAVKPTVDSAFKDVKDVVGLGKLALLLENIAAATYLNGIGILKNKAALQVASTIQPVEMQHAAILNFVLGQYPVPDTFGKTDGARPPSDYTG